MSTQQNTKVRSKTVLYIVALILTSFWSLTISMDFYEDHVTSQKKSTEKAIKETLNLSRDISNALTELPASANTIAQLLQNQDLTSENIDFQLKRILIKNVNISGIGIAFKPYQFESSKRLFSPYFIRNSHQIERLNIADYYDYTQDNYEWYVNSINVGAHWSDVIYDEVRETWLIFYVQPLIQKNRNIGLIFVSYTLDALQKKVDLADLEEQGYSFIIDNTGKFIDYPVLEMVYSTNTDSNLLQNLPGFSSHGLNKVLENIKNKNCGALNSASINGTHSNCEKVAYKSDITSKDSWLFYASIPDMDWTVITVVEKKRLIKENKESLQKFLLLIIAWSTVLILIILILLSLFQKYSDMKYWITSFLISIVLSFDIAAVWYVSLQETIDTNESITPIVSNANLKEFKRINNIKSILNRKTPPLYVPTGVFVQSIEFSSANNVILTGYIWQRYIDEYHEGLTKGIVMPEAESIELESAFERIVEGGTLKGWYFKVTLRQNFDYSHYPLDTQSVWIRMWHKDFDKNVVLTPYLESYTKLNPEWLPGIENDFVLSGWKLDRSYFNYHHNSYNTNFGIDNYVGQSQFPELYYNIVLKRNFFDSFISQLAPLVVVLLMLFAILVTSSRDENKSSLLGFNTSGVLASSSALFFVVMVSHIDLRSSLAAKEIIYLEVFYFVTYITILIVSINSILFSWGIRFPVINDRSWIQFKDNLIPKLLFWPMVSGQLLILTVIALYPYSSH